MSKSIPYLVVGAVLVALGIASAEPPRRPRPLSRDVHVSWTSNRGRLGIVALAISPELRVHLGAPDDRGILVDSVRPDRPAARAGLRVGDVVIELAAAPVSSIADLRDALAERKKGEVVPLTVIRDHQRVEVKATLDDDAASWSSSAVDDDGAFDRQIRDIFDQLRERMNELDHGLDVPGSKRI